MFKLPYVPTADGLIEKAFRAGAKVGRKARGRSSYRPGKILDGEIKRVEQMSAMTWWTKAETDSKLVPSMCFLTSSKRRSCRWISFCFLGFISKVLGWGDRQPGSRIIQSDRR